MIGLILVILCCNIASANQFDFDEAMDYKNFAHILKDPRNQELLGISGEQMYTYFKTMYAENCPANVNQSKRLRIPKIIHQIWIGSEIPREFWQFQQSILKFHPDWEYKLWTQFDLPQLNLVNQNFIAQSRNPGEISDMMRYEILHRYGGVYLDFDFECLKSLESLHYLYDLYIGIQPLDSGLVQLGIGIIGAIPNHPIIKKCIEHIKDRWNDKRYEWMATARTGPIYCTHIFHQYAALSKTIDIALPASYFYPLGSTEFTLKKQEWLQQGSFAVHHWAKSWLYPSFRRPEFQEIKNYQ